MNPLRADFHALNAFRAFGVLHRFNGVEMRTTSVRHRYSLAMRSASVKGIPIVSLAIDDFLIQLIPKSTWRNESIADPWLCCY